MSTRTAMQEKKVGIPGLSKAGRKKVLEKQKQKKSKKGWEFVEYHEDGINSYAIFRAPKTGISKKQIALAVIAGILVLFWLIPGSSNLPSLEQAKPYQLIDSKDFSFAGRKRIEAVIVSSANSKDERAQTAMKAAIELQQKTDADVTAILLEMDKHSIRQGNALALANYAPDNGGLSGDQNWTWEVEASDQPLAKLAINVITLWETSKNSFRKSDGLVDEPKLKAAIAKQIGISIEQVGRNKVFISRETYRPQSN